MEVVGLGGAAEEADLGVGWGVGWGVGSAVDSAVGWGADLGVDLGVGWGVGLAEGWEAVGLEVEERVEGRVVDLAAVDSAGAGLVAGEMEEVGWEEGGLVEAERVVGLEAGG